MPARCAYAAAAARLLPLLALAAAAAQAHVTLPPGGAVAGSVYPAAFRVGHACKGAASTTALKVRLPAGFTLIDAAPRAGWTLASSASEVSWTAAGAQAALPAAEAASFTLRGRIADKPGPLWFKVLQTCDQGQADWSEVPVAAGAAAPEFPAARLDVLPAGSAAVDARGAWARPTVPGQPAAGVYLRLTAPAGARLLGGSTPAAAAVDLHEMRMDGDVMRMRALDQGLDLPPGQAVALRPGGHHLMLTGLKAPLAAGGSIPLLLRFVDRDGREGTLQLQVPVSSTPPDGSAPPPQHRH